MSIVTSRFFHFFWNKKGVGYHSTKPWYPTRVASMCLFFFDRFRYSACRTWTHRRPARLVPPAGVSAPIRRSWKRTGSAPAWFVREVTRTPDLPLRSGFVTQKSKERRAFPCPDFRCHPLCHPGTDPPVFLSKQILKCNLAMDNAAVFSSLHTICRDYSSL